MTTALNKDVMLEKSGPNAFDIKSSDSEKAIIRPLSPHYGDQSSHYDIPEENAKDLVTEVLQGEDDPSLNL
jgi:hypothetical protein